MNRVVFSSEKQDWATPRAFYKHFDDIWDFDIDVCADATNACCERYWTEADDALEKNWHGLTCWMNPPFGYSIGNWVRKAYEESLKRTTMVVCLLPAKTDTRWFHNYCMRAEEIILIKGRMRFSGHAINAPFPCMVVVFRTPSRGDGPKFSTMDRILDEVPE